jgi:hypothetical protein
MTHYRLLNVALMAVALLPSGARPQDAAERSPAEQARLLAEDLKASASRAVVSRETALRAVENAIAAHEKRQQELMAALRDGRKERVRVARENVRKTTEACDQTFTQGEQVVELAALIRQAADRTLVEAKRALEAKTDRDVKQAQKNAKQFHAEAERTGKKLSELVELLKKRWLIPDIATNVVPRATGAPVKPAP